MFELRFSVGFGFNVIHTPIAIYLINIRLQMVLPLRGVIMSKVRSWCHWHYCCSLAWELEWALKDSRP